MTSESTNPGDSGPLSQLMRVGRDAAARWDNDELAAILTHQLNAPIQLDLQSIKPALSAKLSSMVNGEPTFGDLLHHEQAPVELLIMVKDFAKRCGAHPEGPLPKEVATVIHTACIAAALTRCGQKISQSPDEQLTANMRWAEKQPWIDERTRMLLTHAITKLGGDRR